MKIRELIEELNKLDPELLVVMARDEEGNGYGTLREVATNLVYIPEDSEIKLKSLTTWLINHGYSEEDVYGYVEDPEWDDRVPEGEDCIVLWP